MRIEEQRRSMFEDKFGKILGTEKAGDLHTAFYRDSDGRYFRNYVHAAWISWNAALDSVVIELPDTVANTGTLTSTAVLGYKRECREAIEAAGLKVAP